MRGCVRSKAESLGEIWRLSETREIVLGLGCKVNGGKRDERLVVRCGDMKIIRSHLLSPGEGLVCF